MLTFEKQSVTIWLHYLQEDLMAEQLTYKGRPLMRKDNLIYYGSMAD